MGTINSIFKIIETYPVFLESNGHLPWVIRKRPYSLWPDLSLEVGLVFGRDEANINEVQLSCPST